MESRTPSIVDLNAELAKLTMFRRTAQSTRAETEGSVARLASYRDGLLLAIKSSGTDHWERHLTGDELVHILDGTATLEIAGEDGPQSFALRAGMSAAIPQGLWHRLLSSEGATEMTADLQTAAKAGQQMLLGFSVADKGPQQVPVPLSGITAALAALERTGS